MSFNRKGSPEKQNGIKVQGASKEASTVDLHCSKCGTVIGTQKGAITIVAGQTTISISHNDLLCNKCKGLK